MVDKYMEEVVKVNEDPDFHQYMSWEEDQRKIQNSIRKQFREEGLVEGRAEAKLEAAKNLKNNGVSIEIIAKSLGLSKKEIEKL